MDSMVSERGTVRRQVMHCAAGILDRHTLRYEAIPSNQANDATVDAYQNAVGALNHFGACCRHGNERNYSHNKPAGSNGKQWSTG